MATAIVLLSYRMPARIITSVIQMGIGVFIYTILMLLCRDRTTIEVMRKFLRIKQMLEK
jgi:hypothetical protein